MGTRRYGAESLPGIGVLIAGLAEQERICTVRLDEPLTRIERLVRQ